MKIYVGIFAETIDYETVNPISIIHHRHYSFIIIPILQKKSQKAKKMDIIAIYSHILITITIVVGPKFKR